MESLVLLEGNSMDKFLKMLSNENGNIICYNIDILRSFVKNIKDSFSKIQNIEILFAIKANSNITILKTLNDLGIGADCASMEEIKLAKNAGINRISATGPGFTKDNIEYLDKAFIDFDFDNLHQLSEFLLDKNHKTLGIRINISKYNSRFGIDINDSNLKQLLDSTSNKITRIHFHFGNKTLIKLDELYEDILLLVKTHKELSNIESINLGGGLESIFANRQEGFMIEKLKNFSQKIDNCLKRNIKIIIEPGSLITLPIGYLKTNIQTVLDNKHSSTMNISPFNFSTWHKMEPIYHEGEFIKNIASTNYKYTLFGNTCYENDSLGKFCFKKAIKNGDSLILFPVGAYNFNLHRKLHEAIPPKIVIYDYGEFKDER